MTRLKSVSIMSQPEADDMWADFLSVTTPDDLLMAYGPRFPRPLLQGDRLYAFYSYGRVGWERIGWGRLTQEPEELAVWLGLGIWPAHRRQGFQEAIRSQLLFSAFHLGTAYVVEQVRVGVLTTNREHLDRWAAKVTRPGCPWVESGHVWYPSPGYHIFTLTRDDYLKAMRPTGDDV